MPDKAGVSLLAAEACLMRCRRLPRWKEDDIAANIAKCWVDVSVNIRQAELWLCRFHGQKGDSKAWIAMAATLEGCVLPALSMEDNPLLSRYLFMAEEMAEHTGDWCNCAKGWHLICRNEERAARCLRRAENEATSFHDYADCASAWSVVNNFDSESVVAWVRKAMSRAVTPLDWRRCVHELAGPQRREEPAILEDIEFCLERALATSATLEGFRLVAFSANYNLRSQGQVLVVKALNASDRLCRTAEEWGGQITTLAVLINQSQSEPGFDPLLSWGDELKDRYSACLQRFSACRPTSQDWLKVIGRSCRRFPVLSAPDLMARAETTVRTAQDWLDCASMWATMQCPDGRQRASRCRLQGWRETRMMRTS
jgi:hypothetical protein